MDAPSARQGTGAPGADAAGSAAPTGPSPEPASLSRNTAFALAAQVATGAFTAGVTLYLVRALGPTQYGLFALAMAISAVVAVPADFGVTSSATRFIAEVRGHTAAIADVLAAAVRFKLRTTTVVCGLLVVLAEPLSAAVGTPELTWPLRGFAVAVFAQSMMVLYALSFVALGRVSRYLLIFLVESGCEAVATVTAVIIWGGATAAAFGRSAGYLCGALFAVVLWLRLAGRRILRIRRRSIGVTRRPLVRYARVLVRRRQRVHRLSQVDVILVGALLGPTAAAVYQAPLRLVVVLLYPGLALANSVAPRMTTGRGAPDVRAFGIALRALLVLQGAMLAPLIVWAEPITRVVFGPGFEESAAVLRALAPYVGLACIAPLVSTTANYLGEARRRIPITIVTLAVTVVATAVLVPVVGVVGAAVGVSLAYAFYVPAHLRIYASRLGLARRPLLMTLFRSLIGAGCMAVVLAAVGTTSLSFLDWCVGLTAGLIVYATVLLLAHEITRDEAAWVLRQVAVPLRAGVRR